MREPTEMEMRVAKAQCSGWSYVEAVGDHKTINVPCGWPKCGCGDDPIVRAKAAIRAMREPTDEMVMAAVGSFIESEYHAMIDAASPPEETI